MATRIYIQSTIASASFDTVFDVLSFIESGALHLGIWIEQDGVTTILNGFQTAKVNSDLNPTNPLPNPEGSLFGKIGIQIDGQTQAPTTAQKDEFNLNLLNLDDATAANAAAAILSYYESLGPSFSTTVEVPGGGGVTTPFMGRVTDIEYSPVSANSVSRQDMLDRSRKKIRCAFGSFG